MEWEKKLEKLRTFLSSFESAVVAFSGGVDSATLSAICREVIDDVLSVTFRSQATPSREVESAKRVAREIGVEHVFVNVDILSVRGFVENSELRCYYCKKFLMEKLLNFARENGYEAVFEGTNADDLRAHRPGYRAVVECGVLSPWVICGATKSEIRSIARSLGFSFHNAPSLACLATRIPFGIRISAEKLEMVDEAENSVIRISGVKNVRVRFIDGFAVVEVERDEITKVFEKREELREALTNLGFRDVFVNPAGYRSGVLVRDLESLLRL